LNFREKTLTGERSFVGFCAAVLRTLNDESSDSYHQQDMDHSAFVQQKLCDEPQARQDGAEDPEHF
jgi:hypothetical protein